MHPTVRTSENAQLASAVVNVIAEETLSLGGIRNTAREHKRGTRDLRVVSPYPKTSASYKQSLLVCNVWASPAA